MYHNNFFTDEQWECIRVCVANAPIPYDITKKKIPAEILDKIGQPKREEHEGEILIEDNDIIGDDVNIAARIEPFSAPGGIAISNKVHDAIIRESEFNTKYLGKPKLKGVGQKVEVYCITSHGLPETDLSHVSAKLEDEGFQWNVKNSLGVAASIVGLFMLINFLFLRIGFADEEATPSIAILPSSFMHAPQ